MWGGMADDSGKQKNKRNYRDKDVKLLFSKAAGRCAFPDCRKECIIVGLNPATPVLTAEIAHIIASSDDGPRGDSSFPEAERDRYNNLLLLCHEHHRLVDDEDNFQDYPATMIRRWKQDHESWVFESLTEAIPQVNSSELERVCASIIGERRYVGDMGMIPPEEKIRKNDLGSDTEALLLIGSAMHTHVSTFLTEMSVLEATFTERLIASFRTEYQRQFETGLRSDELFEAMKGFAVHDSHSFVRQAAGLGVLTYLFTTCEVFER
jgi:hypothetical protein